MCPFSFLNGTKLSECSFFQDTYLVDELRSQTEGMLSQDSTYQGDRAYFAASQGGQFSQPYWSPGWSSISGPAATGSLTWSSSKVAPYLLQWKREKTHKSIHKRRRGHAFDRGGLLLTVLCPVTIPAGWRKGIWRRKGPLQLLWGATHPLPRWLL